MSTASTPEGWYPDPSDNAMVRWWDGNAWTDRVEKSFNRARSDRKVEKKQAREEKKVAAKERGVERKTQEAAAKDQARQEAVRPDIQAAADRMSYKLGSKREIRKLVEYLWEHEAVQMITSGSYGPGRGVVVLTDQRLFFLKDGVLSNVSEDFPVSKISSIQWSSGMMFGKIIVFASGNQSVITNMMKDDGKAIVDAVRAEVSGLGRQSAATPMPAQSAAQVDPVAQLKTLAELHEAGILTDEEFQEKKTHLLSQIGNE